MAQREMIDAACLDHARGTLQVLDQITERLYEQTMDAQDGVMYFLLDQMADQHVKELMLAYFLMLRLGELCRLVVCQVCVCPAAHHSSLAFPRQKHLPGAANADAKGNALRRFGQCEIRRPCLLQ